MSDIITKRSEIIFLYDIKDANPNGDPLDDNKPRIDEETGINIVTDVRLKRTIRDYIADFKNLEIFIREEKNKDGKSKTKDTILQDMKIEKGEDLLKKCVDIRMFGSTAAIKNKTITYTGPVQFKIGRSMHKVKLEYIKGTTVMPSGEGKEQGTFTEQYILPYSLINFYGIINENAAKSTGLTKDDVTLLIEAMWNGTKNIISRSKVGQVPRLLLKVNYKESSYHIGDINSKMKLVTSLPDEELRDISQLSIDVTELIKILKQNSSKIDSIDCITDPSLSFIYEGAKRDLKSIILDEKFKLNEITL